MRRRASRRWIAGLDQQIAPLQLLGVFAVIMLAVRETGVTVNRPAPSMVTPELAVGELPATTVRCCSEKQQRNRGYVALVLLAPWRTARTRRCRSLG